MRNKNYIDWNSIQIIEKEYKRYNPEYMIVSRCIFKHILNAVTKGYIPPCPIHIAHKSSDVDIVAIIEK